MEEADGAGAGGRDQLREDPAGIDGADLPGVADKYELAGCPADVVGQPVEVAGADLAGFVDHHHGSGWESVVKVSPVEAAEKVSEACGPHAGLVAEALGCLASQAGPDHPGAAGGPSPMGCGQPGGLAAARGTGHDLE